MCRTGYLGSEHQTYLASMDASEISFMLGLLSEVPQGGGGAGEEGLLGNLFAAPNAEVAPCDAGELGRRLQWVRFRHH